MPALHQVERSPLPYLAFLIVALWVPGAAAQHPGQGNRPSVAELLAGNWTVRPGYTWTFSFPDGYLSIQTKYEQWPGLNMPNFPGDSQQRLQVVNDRLVGTKLVFEVRGFGTPEEGCYELDLSAAQHGRIEVRRGVFYIGDYNYGGQCRHAEVFTLSRVDRFRRQRWQ